MKHSVKLCIPTKILDQHLVVLGKTGAGKSSVKEKLATVIEQAKADDPKLLRARITELERAAKSVQVKTETKNVEVPVFRKGEVKKLRDFLKRIESSIRVAGEASLALKYAVDVAKETSANIAKVIEPSKTQVIVHARQPIMPHIARAMGEMAKIVTNSSNVKLPIGETKILSAIIQNHGCTRQQIAVLTGYKRSSRDAYLQRLSVKGLVEISGDQAYATAQGSVTVEVEALPTGPELRDYWLNKLPEGEGKIMSSLFTHYPEYVTRDYLSETTGYKRSSRDAYLQRLSARQLVVFRGRGEVVAAKELFS